MGIFLNLFFSCSFIDVRENFVEITDISNKMNYRTISTQAFMGGSVLYNPKDLESSQLSENVIIGVRLGKVEAKEINCDEVIYTDLSDQVSYGFIKIDSIDKEKISFTYYEFLEDKQTIKSKSLTIAENESIDINNDNLCDLKYCKPFINRAGLEESRWLTFLSSQEELNTSMFAILPEQYSNQVYPAGLLGINTNGRFIVNKYDVGTSARAVVKGICYGDYVLDSQKGTYERVISSNKSYKKARTIEDTDLETSTEIEEINFYFESCEFGENYSSLKLLNSLPIEITSKYEQALTEEKAIEILNFILEDKNFSKLLLVALYSEEVELSEILIQIENLNYEEILQLNRLLLENFYENACPKANLKNGIGISEIFPLLSVIIQNDELEDLQEKSISRAAAQTYSDYTLQKAEIDKLKSEYFFVGKFNYKFNGLSSLLEGVLSEEIENKEEFHSIETKYEINQGTVAENGVSLELGVLGKLNISFGNIEGGLYAGIYFSAETSATISKNLFSSDTTAKKNFFQNESEPFEIDLKFIEFPAVTVGCVTFKVSLNGGIRIPTRITISGKIRTCLFIGFTGFYSVGIDMGVSASVSYKTIRIFRKNIRIPKGINIDSYAKPNFVNKTAYFVGPICDIKMPKIVSVKSVKIEAEIEPFIYVEPRLELCNCFFVGVEVGPFLNLGVGIECLINEQTSLPEILRIYEIFGTGLELNATYGINIKILWKHFDKKGYVNIPVGALSLDRKEYEIKKISL